MEFSRFRDILRTLASHKVEFIVIGGVAAALDGAPVNTYDLDVVHSRAPENIPRLLDALKELDAYYRHHPLRLTPNESHLVSPGHQLLMTRFAALDLLGSITNGRTYDDLLPHSNVQEIAPGVQVRVLDLETLIATKEEAGRDKDLAVLPTLRATLAEIRRRTVETSTTSGCG